MTCTTSMRRILFQAPTQWAFEKVALKTIAWVFEKVMKVQVFQMLMRSVRVNFFKPSYL